MQNHILPFVSGGGGDTTNREKPRILYNNFLLLDDATVTTDAPPVDGYDFQNAYDWRGYTFWRVTTGTYYLTVNFATAKTVNSWAFYATTLAKVGGSISLEYSTDGGTTWLAAGPVITPGDTTPIYKVLAAPILAGKWRVKVVSPSIVDIGCICIGYDFQFERGCWVGFSPPRLARDTDITNTKSQGGVWLGRTIMRNGVAFDFPLDLLTPGWVETYWRPFVIAAERHPFFVLWNNSDFPTDVAYAWSDGPIAKPEYSHVKFMKVGIKCAGKVE